MHPFAEWLKAVTDQVNRMLQNPTIRAAIEAQRRAALMPPGLAQAVAEWDRALDDAEAEYDDALWRFRSEWLSTGKWAQSWRTWASLSLGITEADVMAAARHIAACRTLCDWSGQEVAIVQAGLLEGWAERQRRRGEWGWAW
jgi:hypothetical protein